MKAGGKLLQQEREAELKKIEEQTQARERRNVQQPWATGSCYNDDAGFDFLGGTLRTADPDLFDLVKKALRVFTK
jgi:hypothetical protein